MDPKPTPPAQCSDCYHYRLCRREQRTTVDAARCKDFRRRPLWEAKPKYEE